MATTALISTTIVPATVTLTCKNNGAKTSNNKVVYLTGVNSYGGLKAQNAVIGLGHPASTEQCFANITSSLRSNKKGRSPSGGGGALGSTCNAAAEIFRIAAIMNGLVLVGVAVGFVLLRIEASVEEAE